MTIDLSHVNQAVFTLRWSNVTTLRYIRNLLCDDKKFLSVPSSLGASTLLKIISSSAIRNISLSLVANKYSIQYRKPSSLYHNYSKIHKHRNIINIHKLGIQMQPFSNVIYTLFYKIYNKFTIL